MRNKRTERDTILDSGRAGQEIGRRGKGKKSESRGRKGWNELLRHCSTLGGWPTDSYKAHLTATKRTFTPKDIAVAFVEVEFEEILASNEDQFISLQGDKLRGTRDVRLGTMSYSR